MTNNQLTRERLQEIAEDGFLKHGESKELARMALAAMDNEPVFNLLVSKAGYKGQKQGNNFGFTTLDAARELKEGKYLLYRHAQQPTVAGDGRAEFETWMLKRWGRERRDDDFAMGKFIYGEDYADSYTRCVWKAWSASRAAMLQHQPQNEQQNIPEIIPGWIPVGARMPERGVDVLACKVSPIGGYEEIETAQWHGGMKGNQPVFIIGADTIEPAFWMPLPAAPQEEK